MRKLELGDYQPRVSALEHGDFEGLFFEVDHNPDSLFAPYGVIFDFRQT